jgi:hypothetical protein
MSPVAAGSVAPEPAQTEDRYDIALLFSDIGNIINVKRRILKVRPRVITHVQTRSDVEDGPA